MVSLRSLIDALRTSGFFATAVWFVVSGAAVIAVSCGAVEDAGDVTGTAAPAAVPTQA